MGMGLGSGSAVVELAGPERNARKKGGGIFGLSFPWRLYQSLVHGALQDCREYIRRSKS